MNTFTAQELADFYQQVADGGELQVHSTINISGAKEWVNTAYCPSIGSDMSQWRIKPKKKIIDLSVLIESGIDCELRDKRGDDDLWHIYKLGYVCEEGYQAGYYVWDECRPRMNHINYWGGGGECPLPEGFILRTLYRDGESLMLIGNYTAGDDAWEHSAPVRHHDIIGFEVLGLAEGWKYPWQKEGE